MILATFSEILKKKSSLSTGKEGAVLFLQLNIQYRRTTEVFMRLLEYKKRFFTNSCKYY